MNVGTPAHAPTLPPKVTVVGAGMSGAMVSLFLAKLGLEIEIYESRGDLREGFGGSARSLNMTVSKRGLSVLRDVGLDEEVRAMAVPIRGRIVHQRGGAEKFFPYGRRPDEVLHTIIRNELNALLLDRAEACENVSLRFHKKLINLDKDSPRCVFRDLSRGRELEVESDLVLGADGAFSAVRREMHRRERANYGQEFLDWDYKELSLAPGPGGRHILDPGALHVWPRRGLMLMALPNRDGSFNCICTMPAKGACSFEAFNSHAKAQELFEREFPDFLAIHPDAVDQFVERSQSAFLTTWAWPWHYEDKVVLLGDAAHTVVPFYGQGMISGFEDCRELSRCLAENGADWQRSLREFQCRRKADADALADISRENFYELRDGISRPAVVARKHCEAWIERILPGAWKPIYGMIAHSSMPYAEAVARYRRQQRTARWLGLDLVVGAWGMLLAAGWKMRGLGGEGALPPSTQIEDPPVPRPEPVARWVSEAPAQEDVPATSASRAEGRQGGDSL